MDRAANSVLACLDLSQCQITARGAAAVGRMLAEVGTLNWVDLSWNRVGAGAGAAAVAEGLTSAANLSTLRLEQCSLGRAGAAAAGVTLILSIILYYHVESYTDYIATQTG